MEFNYTDPEFPNLPWDPEVKRELDGNLIQEWGRNETLKRLETDKGLINFMEFAFENEWDKTSFKQYYSEAIGAAMRWGPSSNNYYHLNHNRWIYFTEKALFEILQKKLFDLQCLWRAKQIDIPEIQTTYDFTYWELNIRDAHFIPRITEDEVKIYMDYLQTSEYRVNWKCLDWQDYIHIKDDYHNNDKRSNIPPWYHYHNYATQNSSLLLLPDLRGQEEEAYLAKYDKYRRETLAQNPAANLPDNRPRLDPTFENIKKFMEEFNYDPKLLHYMKGIYEPAEQTGLYWFYEEPSEYIWEENVVMPIESNSDWREAFLDVVYKYRNGKVASLLPDLYADYLQNKLEETAPNRRYIYDDTEFHHRKWYADHYRKLVEFAKTV
jgi:hypothetical protein